MREAGWEVHCASTAATSDHSHDLSLLGVISHNIFLNDQLFDSFIRELNPHIVIFDRYITEEQFGWRVREQCPHALRVIDTQDLHFLRLARKGTSGFSSTGIDLSWPEEETARELASIFRSDMSFLLSDVEHRVLVQYFRVPEIQLVISRIGYPAPQAGLPFDQRADFVFVGNFRHAPNADAVQWLADEIWPLIRQKLPQAKLHIFGAYAPPWAEKLHSSSQGFLIQGRAEGNISDHLVHYRVGLAPLRFGAGIKGKVLEGWGAGLPMVLTPIAAEGMTDQFIAEDASQFAEMAVRLYDSPDFWKSMQRHGHHTLSEKFNAEREARVIINSLTDRLTNRDVMRQKNWIGKILWRESMRSTEFFSRWIELKNRL